MSLSSTGLLGSSPLQNALQFVNLTNFFSLFCSHYIFLSFSFSTTCLCLFSCLFPMPNPLTYFYGPVSTHHSSTTHHYKCHPLPPSNEPANLTLILLLFLCMFVPLTCTQDTRLYTNNSTHDFAKSDYQLLETSGEGPTLGPVTRYQKSLLCKAAWRLLQICLVEHNITIKNFY